MSELGDINMRKIFNGIAMHPRAMNELKSSGFAVEETDINGCEGAIVYVPPDSWIDAAETQGLRAIACHAYSESFGMFAKESGINMILVPSLWRTVAEHTLALMMAAARNVVTADNDIRNGQWQNHETLKIRHSGMDFQGKTLGIIGLGKIGRELAGLMRGFNMNIIYYDHAPMPQWEKELGVSYCKLSELLAASDYLALLLPLNDDTRGFLGAREINYIKPGCVFVNSARGPIIQEDALISALKSGQIAAAGLDVYWDEPLPMGHPLLDLPNTVLAPHLGGSTYDCDMVLVNGILKSL